MTNHIYNLLRFYNLIIRYKNHIFKDIEFEGSTYCLKFIIVKL